MPVSKVKLEVSKGSTTSFLKLFLVFVLICCSVGDMHARNGDIDSIQDYFDRIRSLVAKRNDYPTEFLDIPYLTNLAKKSIGINKVRKFERLYTAHAFISCEIASEYNSKALRLSSEIGYREGELQARYNNAYLLFIKGDFDGAFHQVLDIENELKNTSFTEVKADIATLKSDIFTERGQYDKALEVGLGLLDLGEKLESQYTLMKANAALSHYYLRIGNYSKARTYCLRGLDYIIKLKKTEYFYHKVNEIARMTAKLEGAEKALQIHRFFFELENKMPPPGDYVKSITFMILADIHMSLNELEKAQDYLSRALTLNFKNDFKFRIPRALVLQAQLDLKRKDTLTAISNYEKSIEAADRIDAFDVMKYNSAVLSGLYENLDMFTKSYEYHTLHNAILDSLRANQQEQRINVLEARQKVKEVTQQKQILELKNKAAQGRYQTIAILLACLICVSCLILFGYLKVKEKNKLLYERTIELAKVQLEMKEKLEVFQKNAPNTVSKKLKSEKSTPSGAGIDDEVKDIILQRLTRLEKELFFLEPNCSLHQLSDMLKTNPKYLSQVINQEKKANFNNYINGLRINFLLPKLLKDVEFRNSKLSYIASSVGYNNLNTFNTAFKKRMGILPSYFIERLNLASNEEEIGNFDFIDGNILKNLRESLE